MTVSFVVDVLGRSLPKTRMLHLLTWFHDVVKIGCVEIGSVKSRMFEGVGAVTKSQISAAAGTILLSVGLYICKT
jgi:hypothetical protein